MAKTSKKQKEAQAAAEQSVSGGQVRVDATATTGGKSEKRTSQLHPSLESATGHLQEAGFQSGTVTSPSGVQVQFSRSKGGASGGGGYKARSPEFGDKGYDKPQTGMEGAGRGEARWQVNRPTGGATAQKYTDEAEARRRTPDPVTSHPTLNVVRGLVDEGARTSADIHRTQARGAMEGAREQGMKKVSLTPAEREGAALEARAAGRIAEREEAKYKSSVRDVAKTASTIVGKDPSAAAAVDAGYSRQVAIGAADKRARRASRGVSTQETGTMGTTSSSAQNTTRARHMQGYVHTQQAGADIRPELHALELERRMSSKESQNTGLSEANRAAASYQTGAATRAGKNKRQANRAAMAVNAQPMEQTVGTQPPDVGRAIPPKKRGQ